MPGPQSAGNVGRRAGGGGGASPVLLSVDGLEELVSTYYGRPLRHKIARARLQGTVSQYGWTLWGCIQNGSSALEFDFWQWAMERYDNAVAEFRRPEFSRLLDEVSADE